MSHQDPHKGTSLQLDVLQFSEQTGEVFYVNNSGKGPIGSSQGSDSASGLSKLTPLSTLAQAMDRVTASSGDVIILMPGHAETLTVQIDLDVAGVSIIGVGEGSLKPVFTGNGTIDVMDVSAADIRLENVRFAAPSTDAQTSFVNVDAAGCTLKNISGVGSAGSENVVDCFTLTSNADDCVMEGCRVINSVVAVNSFVSIEGALSNLRMINCSFDGDVVASGIIDAATATNIFMENVSVRTVGTTKPAITLDSNPTGLARNCDFSGTSTTLADNAAMGTGMRLFNIRVLEETDGSAQGALIPAVDAN